MSMPIYWCKFSYLNIPLNFNWTVVLLPWIVSLFPIYSDYCYFLAVLPTYHQIPWPDLTRYASACACLFSPAILAPCTLCISYQKKLKWNFDCRRMLIIFEKNYKITVKLTFQMSNHVSIILAMRPPRHDGSKAGLCVNSSNKNQPKSSVG